MKREFDTEIDDTWTKFTTLERKVELTFPVMETTIEISAALVQQLVESHCRAMVNATATQRPEPFRKPKMEFDTKVQLARDNHYEMMFEGYKVKITLSEGQ